MNAPSPDTPYRPSNGTEFDCFYSKWCEHCTRDDYDSEVFCKIIGDAMIDEPTPEWVYRNGVPTCTAFTDKPLPEPRCEFTKEMF